jgi:hypothetical protein
MTRAKLFLVLAAMVLCAGYAVVRAPKSTRAQATQGRTPCCGEPDKTAPRELDFPYYSLRDGFSSSLLLVSDSPHPTDLVIAIRSASGQTLLAPSLTIQPLAKLEIDLRRLLSEIGADVAGDFAEGSVSVHFEGTIMPVVGQISLTNPARSLSMESEMVENDPGRSDIPAELDGLWWGIGGGRDAKIMVSNMGAEFVTADVFLDFLHQRHRSTPLSFVPHETKVLSITELLAGLNASPSEVPEGGITIVARGPRPALIAQGRVLDPASGFSTTLSFPDPARQKASAIHATGVPIGTPTHDSPFAKTGSLVPHVIVRNLLGSSQNVTITIEYPGDKGPEQKVLAQLPLGAYGTQDFSLDSAMTLLPLPLPYCSVRIQYSGAPGSLMGHVASIDQKHERVMDSRVANEGDGWAGSGANPWHLDNETESVMFLTNMGDRECPVGFRVQANGIVYFVTDLKLKPHETRAIDLRELRDTQKPDLMGNTIPPHATDGSVGWIRLDDVPMMGRLVVLRGHNRIVNNYDCCTCVCPASFTGTVRVENPKGTTNAYTLYVGSTPLFACMAYFQNCNLATSWQNVTTSSLTTWKSFNTSIATVYNGIVTGKAQGQTTIQATYAGKVFTPPYCSPPQDKTGTGQINIQVNTKCADVRDTIVQEYINYDTGWAPYCQNFSQTAHSVYFTFAELNTGDYSWALVKRPLVVASSSGYGLDDWRVQYGSARTINSAYRNPARNAAVGGAPQSRHMFGDAVDLSNQSYSSSCGTGSACQVEWNNMYNAAGLAGADYREPTTGPCGYACTHADWRNHDNGIYAP